MKLSLLALFAILPVYGCGRNQTSDSTKTSSLKEAWNEENNPALLKNKYEIRFEKLPLSAELSRKPWTDTYWPSYLGGLANRWNAPEESDAFKYKPETRKDVLAHMPKDQLKQLSPAEKYDLYVGRLDYPLVREERSRTSPTAEKWAGLCHGWAPAALAYDEPHAVSARGDLGIEIPFGSSDVKALLILSQQTSRKGKTVGERCEYDLSTNSTHSADPACRDTNPGSFHIIIANQIGLLKEGFVADIDRDIQVWNQPIYGFHSVVSSVSSTVYPHAAAGTVKIATVQTEMMYIGELAATWDAKPFDKFPQQGRKLELQYSLELNDRGEIIGGEWISDARPDFIWTQPRTPFTGYFAKLATLYKLATSANR